MFYSLHDRIKHNEKLLAVKITKKFLLTAGTNKQLMLYTLPNLDFNIIGIHDKSIRSIACNFNLFACVSYDGKGTVYKDKKIIDIIEGPETEIKDIAFSENNKYIAVATRGKTVWVLNINEDTLEIDAVIDDHTQDVKGVKFYAGCLYSYGYDNTIKVYEKVDYGNCGWELIQNITEHENTVWNVIFHEFKMISCDNDGYICFYDFDEVWKLVKKFKASSYHIYSLCIVKDRYLAYIVNLNNIAIIDMNCDLKLLIKDLHKSEINSIDYCKENSMLVTVGDDGDLCMLKLSMKHPG